MGAGAGARKALSPPATKAYARKGSERIVSGLYPSAFKGLPWRSWCKARSVPTAGAVVAGQAEEWTDGVVARLPGVEDVQHSGSAKGQEACGYIDGPLGEYVPRESAVGSL